MSASGQLDWFSGASLVLRPRLDVMWRGEDDVRAPWPADAFSGHDLMLVGVVERTVRPSLGGRWLFRHGEVNWDVGAHLIRNQNNVAGLSTRKLVSRVQLVLRTRF